MRERLLLILLADHQRPDLRKVHLLDRYRLKACLGDEPWQIEIGFKTDVDGERREGPFEPRQDSVGAAEVVQDDDPAARLAG